MTGLKSRVFQPNPAAHAVYKELYSLYRKLHDAFGTQQATGNLYDVMKQLIAIRNRARSKPRKHVNHETNQYTNYANQLSMAQDPLR